jgi:hypothetical protein
VSVNVTVRGGLASGEQLNVAVSFARKTVTDTPLVYVFVDVGFPDALLEGVAVGLNTAVAVT